ncbi:MAG: glycosyltransferase family 4 protein [Desulfobacterales bacterium]|nr:glycosyltransferase family 4 protein [Desulfobacterales bacterium]
MNNVFNFIIKKYFIIILSIKHCISLILKYFIPLSNVNYGNITNRNITISDKSNATVYYYLQGSFYITKDYLNNIQYGDYIYIVRGLSLKSWINIFKVRKKLSGIGYIIDDNIFHFSYRDRSVPLKYLNTLINNRLKLYLFSFFISDFFVSNKKLLEFLPNAKIIKPKPGKEIETKNKITVFYDGSSSHVKEFDFVFKLILKLNIINKNFIFFIYANSEIKKKFSLFNNVTIMYPTSWSNYKLRKFYSPINIGLCPLLKGTLNDYRTHTKFFDITRANGVGLYSDHQVYNTIIHDKSTGVLLKNNIDEWVNAIINLSSNKNEYDKILHNARIKYNEEAA